MLDDVGRGGPGPRPFRMGFFERMRTLALAPALDVHVADHCNLRCNGCVHFAPLAQNMQTVSDMLLGWCRLPGEDGKKKDYYVRQLWDGKGSVDLSLLGAKQLGTFAKACGWTLAHAHARTGDRFAISAYLGKSDKFDKAIADFAEAYAYQNVVDYQRFMKAYEAGGLA